MVVCTGFVGGLGHHSVLEGTQEAAVHALEFTDEDIPMQESNLPKVTWPLREGARPIPASRSPSLLQEHGAEKAVCFVAVSLGLKSPKQASLCRHV